MKLFEHTLFINLDERTDRQEHVVAELGKIGIHDAVRVRAFKHPRGSLGCTLSHIQCLEIAIQQDYEHVFVCEDDITFTNPELLLQNISKFDTLSLEWDVLILGGNVCPPFLRAPHIDCCIRVLNCQTTTGYIVRRHYYNKLLNNFRNTATKMMEGDGRIAIDIGWKQLQPVDNWFMIVPATVTQYQNYSDIEKRVVDYNHLMLDIEKRWLFARNSSSS